jgi:hypothetical protein
MFSILSLDPIEKAQVMVSNSAEFLDTSMLLKAAQLLSLSLPENENNLAAIKLNRQNAAVCAFLLDIKDPSIGIPLALKNIDNAETDIPCLWACVSYLQEVSKTLDKGIIRDIMRKDEFIFHDLLSRLELKKLSFTSADESSSQDLVDKINDCVEAWTQKLMQGTVRSTGDDVDICQELSFDVLSRW